MRPNGFKVPPKSKAVIETDANKLRSILGVLGPVVMYRVYEFVLPRILYDFEFEVLPDLEMGADEGRSFPDRLLIQLSESTYEAATRLDGRANFTLAHELGHLIQHRNLPASFARVQHKSTDKLYTNSEWQADKFASYFLMPKNDILATCACADDIARRYFTSSAAANYRWNELTNKK